MFEEAKQVEETQDAGDTLGKTREALPSMRKAQAGDSVQLGMQAGRIEIRLKEFPDVRGIRGCKFHVFLGIRGRLEIGLCSVKECLRG